MSADIIKFPGRKPPPRPVPQLLGESEQRTAFYLSEWRRYRNFSLAVLSDRTGLDRALLSRIERGKVDPGRSNLRAIVDALELGGDVGILFTDPYCAT